MIVTNAFVFAVLLVGILSIVLIWWILRTIKFQFTPQRNLLIMLLAFLFGLFTDAYLTRNGYELVYAFAIGLVVLFYLLKALLDRSKTRPGGGT
jgi:hypothetical protein